jgi:hypothetical protein
LPELPIVGDFVPGYEASAVGGIGAPKGISAEIVNKLNAEINAGLADPDLRSRLAASGSVPHPGSPAEFRKLIADETEKWAKVIKFAGIKPSDQARRLGRRRPIGTQAARQPWMQVTMSFSRYERGDWSQSALRNATRGRLRSSMPRSMPIFFIARVAVGVLAEDRSRSAEQCSQPLCWISFSSWPGAQPAQPSAIALFGPSPRAIALRCRAWR